jgi:molybdate transport system ATP-binding protein
MRWVDGWGGGMACPSPEFRLVVQQADPIVLDARLDCGRGELLALVGPSGSGKSTLLRMIAGLSRPQRGRIECAGACWFDHESGMDLSTQQRRVGYVPQHYGLFPHMTALANVLAGLGHLPAGERLAQARRWLARVDLHGLEQRRPAELSGGQQQRVSLARALARDPSILLLDEPFSAVDRLTRESLYLQLAELRQQLAIPVLLVTHDLAEATLLADRMSLLVAGKTLQSGTPRELVERPATETVARQVGIRNLLDGVLIEHDHASGISWIQAGTHRIAATLSPQQAPGNPVRWMLANDAIRLRSSATSDLPPGRNRVLLRLSGRVVLGDRTLLAATIAGLGQPLRFTVPTRLAATLSLQPGDAVEAVLPEDRIHVLCNGSASQVPAVSSATVSG